MTSVRWDERIGQRLKLRDLHVFMEVVERGSMARAATMLAISQPAVSKAIAALEHTLGVRLLDRSRSGVEPTAYGRALFRRGLAVFDELREGASELRYLADPNVGILRIGSSEAIAAGFLPRVIDDMSRRHAGIVFEVTQALFSSPAYREIRDRSVDLLIGRIFGPIEEEDLSVEVLFNDDVVVIAAAASALARARRINLTDLSGERWVLPPSESPAGRLTSELFNEIKLAPAEAPTRTLSIHIAMKLVATGRFVAVVPSSVLRFGGRDALVRALPVALPPQKRPVGLITLKNRTLSPVAELFLKYARTAAAKVAGQR